MKLFQAIAAPAWAAGLKVICSQCEGCHRSLALRHLSVQMAAIRMHGRWYCGPACFATAKEERLSSLLNSGVDPSSHLSRMPLGLILIDRGWLTAAQLREAINQQKEAGGEIGEILLRCGFASEKQVTAGRATQWGCPVYSAPKHLIQVGIQIPSTLIQIHSAIPLHFVAAKNRLLVGFVHGIEYGLLFTIQQMTGCQTQSCFVTPNDFLFQVQQRELAQRQRGGVTPKEITSETVQTPTEMASIICGYAVEFAADEAIIERCKEYFWTRLKSESIEIDILFKAGGSRSFGGTCPQALNARNVSQ
jgi:hypothetical protein